MLCHREVCLFLKEDRSEHALSRRSPADLALAKDKGVGRRGAAFLLNWKGVKMGKK